MMESYLPNTKFTKEVLFYDDYMFTLTAEEIDTLKQDNENMFCESLSISKFEITSTLDYQPDKPELVLSRRQEHVVSCASIELTCSDGSVKVNEFLKRFRTALVQTRRDDKQRRFNIVRVVNHAYYFAMERDLSQAATTFKLYRIDLDEGTSKEIVELR